MGVQLKQNPDGSMGLEGRDGGVGQFMNAETEWLAASVDKTFYIAQRTVIVQSIIARIDAAGTDAGAVTAVIRKVPSGTAITSGTVLHSGSVNMKGTANTNQQLTLDTITSNVTLAPGDALAIDFTGVLTAAAGSVTVGINPA